MSVTNNIIDIKSKDNINTAFYPLKLEGSTDTWNFIDLKSNSIIKGGSRKFGRGGSLENCKISIDSKSGVATIEYYSSSSQFYLKYNPATSTNRFTCYPSTSKGVNDVYLYKAK